MSETKPKLPQFIEVKIDGEPRQILMSFALVNRVCYLMGDSTQIPMILQDAELREAVLIEAFAERDAKGKVINRKGMDEMEISFNDIQDTLELVSEHVADFTMAAVERANRVMLARKAQIEALQNPSPSTPTPTGPESSVSKNPAA
jgi:hypothetical protein